MNLLLALPQPRQQVSPGRCASVRGIRELAQRRRVPGSQTTGLPQVSGIPPLWASLCQKGKQSWHQPATHPPRIQETWTEK